MILNTVIFVIIYYLILLSTLGFGFLFALLIRIKKDNLSLGIIGLLGFCFLTFFSYLTNFFFAHNYLHNITLHSVGVIFFIYSFIKNKLQRKYFFALFGISILFLLGLFLSKNHDDFPYYHLAFTLNLVESNSIIGIGNFNSGYRTPSSLFYFHSLLYLPYIKYYLFHCSGILILTFSNYFLLERFLLNQSYKKNNFINILSALIFVFINLVFARLAEYGTDRGPQIIAFILIILMFDLLNKKLKNHDLIKIISVFILFNITAKSYFIIYLSFFIIIFYNLRNHNILDLIKKNIRFLIIFLVFFISYFISNILNSGCLVFPIAITCFDNFTWSANVDLINQTNTWYELWAKAGATPNYVIPDRDNYIKYFNWVPNWINNYFFIKAIDIIGVIFLIIGIFFISFFSFRTGLNKNIKNISYKIIYYLLILFFFVWFSKHPDLRYGGYVLIALLTFIPSSIFLSRIIIKDKFKKLIYLNIAVFVIILFNVKNIIRINSEFKRTDMYEYKNFPFFHVEKVNFTSLDINNDTRIYIPKDNNCWATPFPCVEEYQDTDAKKIGPFKIFFKKKL